MGKPNKDKNQGDSAASQEALGHSTTSPQDAHHIQQRPQPEERS